MKEAGSDDAMDRTFDRYPLFRTFTGLQYGDPGPVAMFSPIPSLEIDSTLHVTKTARGRIEELPLTGEHDPDVVKPDIPKTKRDVLTAPKILGYVSGIRIITDLVGLLTASQIFGKHFRACR